MADITFTLINNANGSTVVEVLQNDVYTVASRSMENSVVVDDFGVFTLTTRQGNWQFDRTEVQANATILAGDLIDDSSLKTKLYDLFFLADEVIVDSGEINVIIDPLSDVGALAVGAGEYQPFPNANEPAFEAGSRNLLRLDPSGRLITSSSILTDEGSFRDDINGSAINFALTGTVNFTNGSFTVTGVGTAFLSEVFRGYYLKADTDSVQYQVASVESDTELTLSEPFAAPNLTDTATVSQYINRYSGAGAGITVGSSKAVLTSGTANAGQALIYRDGDWFPCIFNAFVEVSNRRANQTIHIGFCDDPDNPENIAEFRLTGTTATVVQVVSGATSAASGQETQVVTIPNGKNTSQKLNYSIQVIQNSVAFLIDETVVWVSKNHVPAPYQALNFRVKIVNSAAVAATNVSVDVISNSNINQIDVGAPFSGFSLSVAFKEEPLTLTASQTVTTTADYTLLSVVVPPNRTLLVTGVRIYTTNRGGRIRIGTGTVTPVGSPGTTTGNVFGIWELTNTSTNFQSFINEDKTTPIPAAKGGDTFRVILNQSSNNSTVWHATVYYILR